MILGVDLGLSGALVWIDDAGEIVSSCEMPTKGMRKEKDFDLPPLVQLLIERPPEIVVCEEAEGWNSPVAAQVLSRNRGQIETACYFLAIRCKFIYCRTWQKVMLDGTDKNLKPKARVRIVMQKHWADAAVEFDEQFFDAFLIAQYARTLKPKASANK